jgi:hypothetical protein
MVNTKLKLTKNIGKRHDFSIIKICVSLHIENLHRKVYDNQYRQDYKISYNDIPILKYYSILFLIVPDFRAYLKYWKPIIIKAYNIKKLSMKEQLIFWIIRKINVERYSPYSN